MTKGKYGWTDNPTESGIAPCNTDVLNDCLMHLKYESGSSGLEVCDIGTALFVDETKGLRRRLNGQIVDINTNTLPFLTRLLEIKTTNPDYFTDEENWQGEATLNVGGCVYKFVLNYDSTGTNVVSVRLPKYPDYIEVSNFPEAINVVTSTTSLNATGMTPLHFHKVSNNNFAGGWMAIDGTTSGKGSTLCGTVSGSYVNGEAIAPVNLVANLSNIKQTKLKLYYFIQIATGQETENNIVNDIELNNPYVLFKSEYFEAPPYNISWLKSDGEYKPKATYTKPYEALVVENNSSIAVGTIVDLPSGTKYTKHGLSVKLSTASDITDYDFVINTTDETFRLPLKTKLASGKGVVGNGMTIGVTNGTLNAGLATFQANVNATKAIGTFITSYGQPASAQFTSSEHFPDKSNIGLTTDPEKSGIELSDSGLLLYYYVGETVQNANLIDAGRIAEELNNKISKSECKSYVVETYQSDTTGRDSWYRIWSDGWCEQGGLIPSEIFGSGKTATITLLKPLKNAPSPNVTCFYPSSRNTPVYWGGTFNVTDSVTNNIKSVTVQCSNASIHCLWKVEGYLA